jgi:broad specificity phosphatase PhoE
VATTLWLVRHGETQFNVDGIFQGQLDTQLNARGRRQARQVAEALHGQCFDAVYSSDLSRCVDTVRAIADLTGNAVAFEPDLREMHYGVLQGVRYDQFRDVLAAHGLAEAWGTGVFSRDGMAPPDGESIHQLRERAERFVARLDHEHPPETGRSLLVVSHGGTLRALMTVLLGLPIEERSSFAFANCSVTRVVRDGSGVTAVDCANEVYWHDEEPSYSAADGEAAHGINQASNVVVAREIGRRDSNR